MQVGAAAGAWARKMDVDIASGDSAEPLLARVWRSQEIVVANSLRYQLLKDMAPQNKSHAFQRVCGVEALLKGVNGVAITKGKLGRDGFVIQLQQPEVEPSAAQQELRQLDIELATFGGEEGAGFAERLPAFVV